MKQHFVKLVDNPWKNAQFVHSLLTINQSPQIKPNVVLRNSHGNILHKTTRFLPSSANLAKKRRIVYYSAIVYGY